MQWEDGFESFVGLLEVEGNERSVHLTFQRVQSDAIGFYPIYVCVYLGDGIEHLRGDLEIKLWLGVELEHHREYAIRLRRRFGQDAIRHLHIRHRGYHTERMSSLLKTSNC